jgi:hypothetical protein
MLLGGEPDNAIGSELKKLLRTYLHATLASNALLSVIEYLRPGISSFRVMTPDTMQRASFQKESGTDTRSIVDGKTLDVKNECHFLHKKTCNKDYFF